MSYLVVYEGLTPMTILTELAIPFLIWFRPTRPYILMLAIGLQLWILCFMKLLIFPLFTISSTLVCLKEDELPNSWRRPLQPARSSTGS